MSREQGESIEEASIEEAMFGAGCFWGVEEAFRAVPGVIETAVGFAGGSTDDVSYESVCSGGTGHAEVVHVRFDPVVVPYRALLEVFFTCHDPTQLNRQGPDIGSQYRSAIFVYGDAQRRLAEVLMDELIQSRRFDGPIVTTIEQACRFFRAEDYHQQYLSRRGQSSCSLPPTA